MYYRVKHLISDLRSDLNPMRSDLKKRVLKFCAIMGKNKASKCIDKNSEGS